MTDSFTKLSSSDIKELISALRSKRIVPPYSELQLGRILPPGLAEKVASGFAELVELGFTPEQILTVLELLENERNSGRPSDMPIDLVTSGPEAPGISNRDTSVVVRELFTHARTSVLVVGYAVYQGDRVFEALAKRMEELPDLEVQLYLNISRPDRDTTASEILVSRFAHRFKSSQWPKNCRLPEIYYDPRSVADDQPARSSLHAKCIVVDSDRVFVSSANFTEAGQKRNIEVGLSIRSDWLGNRLIRHFKLMREHGLVERAFKIMISFDVASVR